MTSTEVEMNIYEELANSLEDRILKGTIESGHKLPSVREMSLREGISPSTVVEAYELLRSRGLIESKNKSGFFVSYLPGPGLDKTKKAPALIPTTNLSADMIKAVRLATHDPKIFPFGTASPLPEFYPTKALNRTISKVLNEEPALMSEYRFPPGSLNLRDQISSRYAKFGVKLPVEAVVTTSGAIESIGLALRAVANPGDVIAVETPMYFGILQLVRSLHYKVIEVPIEPEVGLTPERVSEAIAKSGRKLKAIVTVSNFSNPMGSLVPDKAKEEIIQMAGKNNVVIIEDDIYGDLFFQGQRPKPYKAFDKDDQVILCGSFAKTISPSLRVGFAMTKKYASAIAYLKTATNSGVSALNEEALAHFLATESFEKHLRFLRTSYKTLIAQYSSSILNAFPEGTRLSRPQGGFVLWVQLPKGSDSREVQRLALHQSISIAPGPIFSASHKDHINFIRVNCAVPWTNQSQKAIEKLGKIIGG